MIELRPPPDSGFGGTALFDINHPDTPALVAELERRGYTIVPTSRP